MAAVAVPQAGFRARQIALPDRVAVVSLAIAGGAHLGAFPAHRAEGALVAAFFLTLGGLQVAAAAAAQRHVPAGLRASIVAGTIGVLVLWALSRTVGIPVTHAGVPESVGLVDGIAVVAQVLTIGTLIGPLRRPHARRHLSRLLLAAVVIASSLGSAWLMRSAHAHGHDGASHRDHQDPPTAPTTQSPVTIPTHGQSQAGHSDGISGAETTPTTVDLHGHSHAPGHEHAGTHPHP